MAVAVLNRNEPAFYCVPAKAYEELMDLLEDLELAFHPQALREGQKLPHQARQQFKAQPAERLVEPRNPASKLRGSSNRYKIRYKIKLRSAGFRLVDEVRDRALLVVVVAVGRRDRNAVYLQASRR